MKPKLIISIILIVILSWFIYMGIYQKPNVANQTNKNQTQSQVETSKPQIVSTVPDPLDETIIAASQIIEFTFNKPLENVGEFKIRIDPVIEFKSELSSDRKTAKIIPIKPFELGITYTLFIGPETKFDGVGRWGEEKVFHFRTVKYRGI